MSRFAEHLLVQVMLLDLNLRCALDRLAVNEDPEALHDLRIALRSLRSVLRPLRGLPGVDVLSQAAAALGELSNPLREAQVLTCELQRLGQAQAAAALAAIHDPSGHALPGSTELQHLLAVLDGFPALWRLAVREGCMAGLRRQVRRRLRRAAGKLPLTIHGSEDLHALRLQVKRLRYASEAYPQLTPLTRRQLGLLRQLQNSLGEWNDCQHWLSWSAGQPSLASCRSVWLATAEAAASRAEVQLASYRQGLE